MIRIGLTGGMGSGKSFVAQAFNDKGIPVYNADSRAKALMETHPYLTAQLIGQFGAAVYADNKLNRALIAHQIFKDKSLLDWMNNLVHPVVQQDYEAWVHDQKAPFVIKEAAILIESGAYKKCDKIIVVTAPESLRMQRVMARDKMTAEQFKERVMNQLHDSERLTYADFTIINDGIMVVSEQVDEIYNNILELKL